MKPTTTAEYERQREHIITLLNTVFGPDAVMPLSEIAPLLPINPEWARYCPKRRAPRGCNMSAHICNKKEAQI